MKRTSFDEFSELWKGSGLEAYYERMDDLQRNGMTFDSNGDLDHHQSEAISLILGDKPIMDVDSEAVPALCGAAIRVSFALKRESYLLTDLRKLAGEWREKESRQEASFKRTGSGTCGILSDIYASFADSLETLIQKHGGEG